MIKKIAFACSIAVAVLVLTSAKPDKSIARYDSAVQAVMADNGCIGVQTAVIKGSKLIFSKAYGVKNLETGEPLTTANIFKVGLLGRVLVPIAIYQLYDNKMLSLKDDISKYLGFELRNPDFPDKPITITNLLLQNSTLTDEAKSWKSIENLKSTDPDFNSLWGNGTPGSTYNKCTKGFIILAAIVEKITGLTFEEYAKEYIFKPLQIKASYSPADFEAGDFALSYAFKNGEFKEYNQYKKYNRDNYVPGESTFKMRVKDDLMISAEDLSKIIMTVANKGLCPLYKVRLYSEAASAIFLKPVKSNKRCRGINITTKWVEGMSIYYATAAWGGTNGIWGFDPETGEGFVAITNGVETKDFQKAMREAWVDNFLN